MKFLTHRSTGGFVYLLFSVLPLLQYVAACSAFWACCSVMQCVAVMMMIAFITLSSSSVPLVKSLYAQIHESSSSWYCFHILCFYFRKKLWTILNLWCMWICSSFLLLLALSHSSCTNPKSEECKEPKLPRNTKSRVAFIHCISACAYICTNTNINREHVQDKHTRSYPGSRVQEE